MIFAAEYSLFDMLVFLVIGFFLGSGMVSVLFLKYLHDRLNIRIFFEKIVESKYDDYRYRGESPVAGQGEDVPYLG